MKLPAHRAGLPGHAVANRMRAKEFSFLIVPLDPAYKAGLAGHLPVKNLVERDGAIGLVGQDGIELGIQL